MSELEPIRHVKKGDYVLATKYDDGDSGDGWCVGFVDGLVAVDRFLVVDNEGKQFRRNGFRRCQKISTKRGEFIINNMKHIELGFKSLWWWNRQTMKGFQYD